MNMKIKIQLLNTILSIFLSLCIQNSNGQIHKISPTAGGTSKPAKENFISHSISKTGTSDHGIYNDTVSSKIELGDPVNNIGKKYKDIKVNLEEGDVFKVELNSEIFTLSFLNSENSNLKIVKDIVENKTNINSRILYKANLSGLYILRITNKEKSPTEKSLLNKFYEKGSFSVYCLIANSESGNIKENPTLCEQIEFLLRQKLTNFIQITGPIKDTTMDGKKILTINHFSTFAFKNKNRTYISTSQDNLLNTYWEDLYYIKKPDALKAQQYYVKKFEPCLGSTWQGVVDEYDQNDYIFKIKDSFFKDIGIAFNPNNIGRTGYEVYTTTIRVNGFQPLL